MHEVVLSDNVKNTIQRYSEDTLTSIVQLDHVGDLLHSDAPPFLPNGRHSVSPLSRTFNNRKKI